MLKNFYDNFQCCVFVAGKQLNSLAGYNVVQGVHQGGPLSNENVYGI